MFFATQPSVQKSYLPTQLPQQGQNKALSYISPSIPADEIYAYVQVGQRVIATISNNGHIKSAQVFGRKNAGAAGEVAACGPMLAEQRTQQLSRAYGGQVVHASTALTQSEWERNPAVMWRIDCAALACDGYSVAPDFRQAQFTTRDAALHAVMKWFELVA